MFSDVNKIRDGIGTKLGNCIKRLSTFFVGMVLSFIVGWKLALVSLWVSQIYFISGFAFKKVYDTFCIEMFFLYDILHRLFMIVERYECH